MDLVPEYFKDLVRHRWADAGERWLDKLESDIIPRTVESYSLGDISVRPSLAMNLLWECGSSSVGDDVFVKFGNPSANTESEICYMRIAQENEASDIARCLVIDDEDRVIVTPRIRPGLTLDSIDSLSERIDVVSKLASTTSFPVPYSGLDGSNKETAVGDGVIASLPFRNFRDVTLGKIARIKSDESGMYDVLLARCDIVKEAIDDIAGAGLHERILHADLHCENIIESGDRWIVIDPLGYVGEEVHAASKFLSHELVSGRVRISPNEILGMEREIAKATGQDLQLLLRALYADVFGWHEFAIRGKEGSRVLDKLADIEGILESLIV